MYEIGWFSTGRDEAARQLLLSVHKALSKSSLQAHIHFVFLNRQEGERPESDKFIKLVRELGIEPVCFSSAEFEPQMRKKGKQNPEIMSTWREDYDREILRLLTPYQPKFIVLAGYMLIVSPILCDFYNMINLHPAIPGGPKGTWQQVIWQLIKEKARQSGVTIHLVSPKLDAGQPITYCTYPIKGEGFDHLWLAWQEDLNQHGIERIKAAQGEAQPLFAEIRRQGVIRELPLLTQTVQELVSGDLQINDGKIFRNGKLCPNGCLIDPYCTKA